jgi:hypothetical protein
MSSCLAISALPVLVILAGCAGHGLHEDPYAAAGQPWSGPPGFAPHLVENPMFLPVVDREFAWNQLVDTVDDYFRIEREEPVRFIGGVLTEGRLETYPQAGSTLLEPWRRDSTRGFERWHSTLQSVRRRAHVQVLPSDGGFLFYVQVVKELEDVDHPQEVAAGASTPRHDSSLLRRRDIVEKDPLTLGWIPFGRDTSLEQQILMELRGRLTDVGPPQRLPPIE